MSHDQQCQGLLLSDVVGHVTNCAEDEIVLGEILTRINELSNQVSEALGNNYAHI